ncbi:hypothetical protein LOC67_18915 [Stieleria sp. JC731]|nr:hypothetical protein [Stieleria sp. JC731]MCC9602626.1 hypothetical protein [Stieleria sp. JC731]
MLRPSKIPAAAIVSSAALLLICGCRNTTTGAVGPLGQSTTLAPVQGGIPLSPIQPTSGVSAFGSPTRVPPPPTGSYSVPGGYGGSANYAPTNSSSAVPSGAAYNQAGLTRGVTDLTNGNAGYDNSIRQTGWVSETPQALPTQQFAPAPLATPTDSIRSGGMQVIDLTGSPYPPGYVPPQNRPGVYDASTYGTSTYGTSTYSGSNSVALPQSAPYPNAVNQNFVPTSGYQQAQDSFASQQTNVNLGQPVNSTFVSTPNGFANSPTPQVAAQHTASLPSTEPIADGGDSSLQWRRPQPRF